jgi:hypothetical protein
VNYKYSQQLFTDLVFADFLVSHTPYISKVVFQSVSHLFDVARQTPDLIMKPQVRPLVRIRCDTTRFCRTARCYVSPLRSWPRALGTGYRALECIPCRWHIRIVGSTGCNHWCAGRDGELLDFAVASLGNALARPKVVGHTLWEWTCHIQGELMGNPILIGFLSLVPLPRRSQGDLK